MRIYIWGMLKPQAVDILILFFAGALKAQLFVEFLGRQIPLVNRRARYLREPQLLQSGNYSFHDSSANADAPIPLLPYGDGRVFAFYGHIAYGEKGPVFFCFYQIKFSNLIEVFAHTLYIVQVR